MKPLLFAFPAHERFAASLATLCGAELGRMSLHEFPDGEVLVRLEDHCAGRGVVIVCGGQAVNATALPLNFAAATARELGASSVGLVSPYLAYMRQDTRFHPGETVSAVAYARFLSASFDWLVTVDPHLHRLATLDDVFTIPATSVSATAALAPWIQAQVPHPVIIGPDRESEQWAASLAARLGIPFSVLEKTRSGDREVSLSVPDPRLVAGRTPVIIDDIASSGRTLARTVEALLAAGSHPPVCVVVHALFAADAEEVVARAGAARIVSSNTIAHASNEIDVTPLVSAALARHLPAGS
jgi:ribose-phosphate pyrophosphokinase